MRDFCGPSCVKLRAAGRAAVTNFGPRATLAQHVNAFCDYHESLGTHMPSALRPLINCTQLIPCSTAECECGFNHINIIVVDRRASLLTSHVSSLLFVKLNGLPLSSWNPSDHALSWLRHHRRALDTRIKREPPTLEENPV